MALFRSLHEVAEVLAEHIAEQLGLADVQAGPPRDASAGTTAGVRITLLYTTPQSGHRNDPWERGPDGTATPPPITLSCFYLVTTSGADAEDPIAAHNALGEVLQVFHDQPVLSLPLTESMGGSPGSAYTELGEGPLSVVQVPMVLDQLDKIWTPLDIALQPWVLYEVGPVQLASTRDSAGPVPLVLPGIGGVDVRARRRPVIERVSPALVGPGGRVRIDASIAGTLEGLRVGGVWVPATDGSISRLAPGVIVLTLDDDGLESLGDGRHPLSIVADGMASRRASLVVTSALPTPNALATLRHDPSTNLELTGSNLGDVVAALAWPDGGLASTTEVHHLGVAAVGDETVTVLSIAPPPSNPPLDPPLEGLSDLGASRRGWRLALRVGTHVYTHYVRLELGS